MVISFEEKDREQIEAKRMTVIEFKKILYRLRDWYMCLCDALIKYYNTLPEEEKKELLKAILRDEGGNDGG